MRMRESNPNTGALNSETFQMKTRLTVTLTVLLVLTLLPTTGASTRLSSPASTAKPRPAPARWRALIGEYALANETVIILEDKGNLCALFKRTELAPLREVSADV